jgi:uncharacterized RDD family membrane protein YckC
MAAPDMIDHDGCRSDGYADTARTGSTLPRLAAFALDAATYLIIPALLLPLGLLLIRRGVMLSSAAVNAVGLALVIAPATAWATWREARPRGATPGKRRLRLGVIDKSTDALVSARRSLTRNVIKIAVPWELGHTVALGYVSPQAPTYRSGCGC